MTTATPAKKQTVFLIKPMEESGISAMPRLVRAETLTQARKFVLDAFHIGEATVDDAVSLGAQGVEIINATA